MSGLPDWLLIAVGLVTLMVSADLLVRGSVWIALALGVRPLVVGLTVVAFGTSAPELAAALAGALGGQSGLATGTVLGSNIANIGLILGVTALYAPIEHPPDSSSFELRCLLGLTLLSPALLLTGGIGNVLGVALLVFLGLFTWRMLQRERVARRRTRAAEAAADGPPRVRLDIRSALLNLTLGVVGIIGLPLGASWLVDGASSVAGAMGISPQIIGVAVVAVGTSLPELAASLVAAAKKHPEMALGNVLGSNIFNICMVLGGTALIAPLPVTWAGEGMHLLVGVVFTLALALLLGVLHRVTRLSGLLLVLGYATYLGYSVALD